MKKVSTLQRKLENMNAALGKVEDAILPHLKHYFAKEVLSGLQSRDAASDINSRVVIHTCRGLVDKFKPTASAEMEASEMENALIFSVMMTMMNNYDVLGSLQRETREKLVDTIIKSGIEVYNDVSYSHPVIEQALETGRRRIARSEANGVTVNRMKPAFYQLQIQGEPQPVRYL